MVSNNSTFIGSSSTTMIRAVLIRSEGIAWFCLEEAGFVRSGGQSVSWAARKKALLGTVVAGVSPAPQIRAADTAATTEITILAAGGASTASIAKLPLDEFDFHGVKAQTRLSRSPRL